MVFAAGDAEQALELVSTRRCRDRGFDRSALQCAYQMVHPLQRGYSWQVFLLINRLLGFLNGIYLCVLGRQARQGGDHLVAAHANEPMNFPASQLVSMKLECAHPGNY